MKTKLFCISAPSGCGKSTLIRELLSNNGSLKQSVSFTTRNPRDSEVHGEDYFFVSNRSDGFPNDSVTRFHLGNGAILDRINFCADTSAKALNSSAGIMVNYRYDLLKIDENHQMYFDEKNIEDFIINSK